MTESNSGSTATAASSTTPKSSPANNTNTNTESNHSIDFPSHRPLPPSTSSESLRRKKLVNRPSNPIITTESDDDDDDGDDAMFLRDDSAKSFGSVGAMLLNANGNGGFHAMNSGVVARDEDGDDPLYDILKRDAASAGGDHRGGSGTTDTTASATTTRGSLMEIDTEIPFSTGHRGSGIGSVGTMSVDLHVTPNHRNHVEMALSKDTHGNDSTWNGATDNPALPEQSQGTIPLPDSPTLEIPMAMSSMTSNTATPTPPTHPTCPSSPLSFKFKTSDQSTSHSPPSHSHSYVPTALAKLASRGSSLANSLTNSNSNSGHKKPKSASSPSAPFDFDSTLHRRRGNGILASHNDLSANPRQFAAGCTLLQLCAIGDLSAVQTHLRTDFDDVNFRDYDRRTALHVASSEGHLDVVKFLVSKGAKINRSDRWGGSPLDDAHRHRHTAVASFLRSRGGRTGSTNVTTNLIAAAAAGDIEEVKMLLLGNEAVTAAVPTATDGGDYLSVSLANGRTLTAAANNHSHNHNAGNGLSAGAPAAHFKEFKKRGMSLDVSEPSVLAASTVDISKGDYDKRTALHLAAGEGHVDVVEFLCRHGADVNARDRWGGKPLDDALQKGNERVADVLRRYGATSAESDDDVAVLHGSAGTKSARNLSMPTQETLFETEDENLQVDFNELEMIERIGSGAFGEIYKCRWRGILVAAKCIKASKIQKEWLLKNRAGMDKSSDRLATRLETIRQASITEEEKQLALEDFRRETSIMRRLRHPNIVMMLAYSQTEDVEVMISELMRCSLLDVFKANALSGSQIPKRTQIVYAQQLAQGMNHLHKSRPPIIHRDLKPANLLIDFTGTLKITDFGLAKIRPNPEQCEVEAFMMTGETGSYRFMAPEVFRHEEYTETVDVYSYAMIFYYMLRGIPPWSGLSGVDAATKAAVDGERPIIPRDVDERLSTLLKRCWDENPKARPSFQEIISLLNGYSHDVFKTDDKEVTLAVQDKSCGCVVS